MLGYDMRRARREMPVQSTAVEILAALHPIRNGFSRFGQTYARRADDANRRTVLGRNAE
jgi:hypothetical protein